MVLFAGCASGLPTQNGTSSGSSAQSAKKIEVVTSFYPLYELASTIGGDKIEVSNLVPPGSEPHDYEPSPQDIIRLNNAQLVVLNGAGFESWSGNVVPDLQSKGVTVVELSKSIGELLQGTPESEATSQGSATDPHFWLDPVLYQQEARFMGQTLGQIDPSNKDYYAVNAENFANKLQKVADNYQTGLSACPLHSIVTSHAAFGYLAKRYGLTVAAISGLSPDSEPSPRKIAELTDLVKQSGIKYIFTETLLSPKIADTLASEANVQTLVFNPLEGLTKAEMAAGEDYISVMERNLQQLRLALGC
jgi:zinc transport system substrate-binding protein